MHLEKPMNRFPHKLTIDDAGMRDGSRIFRLAHPFTYVSSLGEITVPNRFETDGASVPRAFWPIFSPFGQSFKAAVIHDYLYSRHNIRFNRAESDGIFLEAMDATGVSWMSRQTIYRVVRMFGANRFRL
jgi:hypothetical protein